MAFLNNRVVFPTSTKLNNLTGAKGNKLFAKIIMALN